MREVGIYIVVFPMIRNGGLRERRERRERRIVELGKGLARGEQR
jgi:hypothetical protein